MESIGKFIGPVLSVVGTLATASGQTSAGSAANTSAEFQAAQLTQAAGQSRASSQRLAMELRRQGRLKGSKALAIAAAGGGGASDPTIVDLLADIAAEGEFAALTALFEGSETAAGQELQAAGLRQTGATKEKAGKFAAFTTLLSGASSMFLRFGQPVDGEDDDFAAKLDRGEIPV